MKRDKTKDLYVNMGYASSSEYDAMGDRLLDISKEDNVITAPAHTMSYPNKGRTMLLSHIKHHLKADVIGCPLIWFQEARKIIINEKGFMKASYGIDKDGGCVNIWVGFRVENI